MKAKEAIELLKCDSVFWSKLGFFHDPPRFEENGKMIVFGDDFERFGKYHRDFTAAGVAIHTSILFSGWIGVDEYDYTLTDQVLDEVFKDDADIWFIPRIKLNVPLDWGTQNPEDLCVYFNGPREKEEIRRLVNTEKHDILGYESPVGYYTSNTWKDTRPNIGGVISNQSFSSRKWLEDAGETLRRVIRHIENSPYGERVLAYHIAYGVSGETCLWGRSSQPHKFGDYGVNNRLAFFDWGIAKYGNLSELRAVWRKSDLERSNCEPPPPELREGCSKNATEFLRMSDRFQICVDYDEFMSETNANAIEHFAKIAKEESDGKATGCFYGYFLEVNRSAYTGHLEFDRLLESPYLDFFAAPKSYYRNAPGEPGGELGPAQSVNRKKLWLEELDNRTHLCDSAESVCDNFEDTRCVMWREFAKTMAHSSGMWWMDLGGGWFDSPEILAEISEIEKVRHQLNNSEGKSVSEILLVVDEEAFYYFDTKEESFHNLLMKDFVREAHLIGTPIDIFRQRDLEEIDLAQYKLICFQNAFVLTNERWRKIESKINQGTTLLWNYFVKDAREITGFHLKERSKLPNGELIFNDGSKVEYENLNFPLFEIQNCDENEIIAKYSDGGTACAMKLLEGRRNVFCAFPVMKAAHIRKLAEIAGCHMYAPLECAVYGDSRFLGVFPHVDIDAEIRFTGGNAVKMKIEAKRHGFYLNEPT